MLKGMVVFGWLVSTVTSNQLFHGGMRTDVEQLSNPEQFCFTSEPCLKVLEPTVTDSTQSFPSFTEQFTMKTSNLEENSGTKTLNRKGTKDFITNRNFFNIHTYTYSIYTLQVKRFWTVRFYIYIFFKSLLLTKSAFIWSKVQ